MSGALPYRLPDTVLSRYQSAHLAVWTDIHLDLELVSWERDDGEIGKLCKTVQEFHTFIDLKRAFIPNYGERYGSGEGISTGFVESRVHQVVSKRMVKK